tara:strand:+ start:823 stop:2901 length:2079 start_codon:yes stop_codon:yes gene_type:complete
MFFELSKDKSLLYVLSKVELDDETRELVTAKASAGEIKKSLIKNINPSNMFQYRKYISIAKQEEDYGELEGDVRYRGAATARQAQVDAGKGRGNVSEAEQRRLMAEGSAEAISAEARQKTAEANRQNSLQREILTYEELIPKLREMIKTIQITQPVSDQKVISGQSPYKNVTKTKSERLITTLVALKKEGNYLIKRASEFTENGDFPIYSGKMYKKKTNTYTKKKSKREINIHDMNNTLLELSKAKLDNHDVDLLATLGEIHLEKFNAEAKALQNIPSIRRDMSTLRQRLKDRDTKGHVETYKRARTNLRQTIKSAKNYLESLENNLEEIKEYNKNLKELPEETIRQEIEDRIANEVKEIKIKLSNLVVRETEEGKKIIVPKRKVTTRKDKQGKTISEGTERPSADPRAKETPLDIDDLGEIKNVPEYFTELLDRIQEMRNNLPKEIKEEIGKVSDRLEENNKKIDGLLSKFNVKFLRNLSSIVEKTDALIDKTDEVKLPSKSLSSSLTESSRMLSNLVGSIKKLFREIEDMGEEAKKEWKEWLKQGKAKQPSRDTMVGVDMKGITDMLTILPEMATKQLEDLGLKESDIKQANILVGEITGLIPAINDAIKRTEDSIPSAEVDTTVTPEQKKKDFEETGEYTTRPEVGRTEYDYREEETSWTEEDYTDEQQLGGKEYQARARAERAKRKED